jgi:DNA-binding NarL/FixJ family response regulator
MKELSLFAGGDFARRALDALDSAVLVLSADLERVMHKNVGAAMLFPDELPASMREMIECYVSSRRDQRRQPPPVRLVVDERWFYLRVMPAGGDPPLEIVLLSEELLRDADAFRLLNTRYGVSHREYAVLRALRLGKTNRQIADELGLAEGTIALHVHHLLERFEAPNRTRLVKLVEEVLARRT